MQVPNLGLPALEGFVRDVRGYVEVEVEVEVGVEDGKGGAHRN